jgi:hypothetical protein
MSETAWHAVGDALAPKQIWADTMNIPGMASLTLLGSREGTYEGYQQVTVQPSALVQQGIYISHNDHFTLTVLNKPVSTQEQLNAIFRRPAESTREKIPTAIEALSNEWNNSMIRASAVIERIALEAKS